MLKLLLERYLLFLFSFFFEHLVLDFVQVSWLIPEDNLEDSIEGVLWLSVDRLMVVWHVLFEVSTVHFLVEHCVQFLLLLLEDSEGFQDLFLGGEKSGFVVVSKHDGHQQVDHDEHDPYDHCYEVKSGPLSVGSHALVPYEPNQPPLCSHKQLEDGKH